MVITTSCVSKAAATTTGGVFVVRTEGKHGNRQQSLVNGGSQTARGDFDKRGGRERVYNCGGQQVSPRDDKGVAESEEECTDESRLMKGGEGQGGGGQRAEGRRQEVRKSKRARKQPSKILATED